MLSRKRKRMQLRGDSQLVRFPIEILSYSAASMDDPSHIVIRKWSS